MESLAHEIFAAAHPGWVVAGRTALVGRRRTGADFPRAPPQLTNGVLLVYGPNKKRPGAASAGASWKGRRASRPSSKGAAGSKARPEITVFSKSGGPLTKCIALNADGSIHTDRSACVMSAGTARRAKVANVGVLAALIERLKPYQAIALGVLRDGLPDQVNVVTKEKLNGVTQPNVIARSGDDIIYRAKNPAFALIDFDTKGMPAKVAAKIKKRGGLRPALLSVMPGFVGIAKVIVPLDQRRFVQWRYWEEDQGFGRRPHLPRRRQRHRHRALSQGAARPLLARWPGMDMGRNGRSDT